MSAGSRVASGGFPAELGPRLRVRLPLSPFLSPYSCSPLLSRVVQVAQPRWAGHRALIAPRSLALRELFLCDPLRRTTDSPLGSFDARPRASPFFSQCLISSRACVCGRPRGSHACSLSCASRRSSISCLLLCTRGSHVCFAPASKASLALSLSFLVVPSPWFPELTVIPTILVSLVVLSGGCSALAVPTRASLPRFAPLSGSRLPSLPKKNQR